MIPFPENSAAVAKVNDERLPFRHLVLLWGSQGRKMALTIDLASGIQASPDRAFKYAELETAIASLHNVSPSAMKTLRGRVRHFQRIGLVPSSPGKGQKLQYRVADAIVWAVCFELAELGLPPEQIKDVIRLCSHEFFRSFRGPIQSEDLIFILRGNFLEWHLNDDSHSVSGTGRTSFGLIPVSKVCDQVFIKAKITRVLLINMTSLKRELGKALEIEWV